MLVSATMLPLAMLARAFRRSSVGAGQGVRVPLRPFKHKTRYLCASCTRLQQSSRFLATQVDQNPSSPQSTTSAYGSKDSSIYLQLEEYLPWTLRRPSMPESESASQSRARMQSDSLPDFLHRFRQASPQGALSFLASQDDRLEALIFLAGELFSTDQKPVDGAIPLNDILKQSPWLQATQATVSLDDLSRHPHTFVQESRSTKAQPNLEESIDSWDVSDHSKIGDTYREAIGELWTVLGEIAIRASNLTGSAAKGLMQHAQVILARMHSNELVPTDAYGYDESKIPTAYRKPPYLHVLGSRMMATMSDATWHDNARSLPVSSVSEESSSLTHQLHPNVWLEFVLWACVRQGYYVEAAKLISVACLAVGDATWRILTWDQVLALQRNPHRRQQSWFDKLMSLEEGYNEERPLIEMPPKSISCEVVVCILQGLLPLEDAEPVRLARRASFYAYCQSLKDRDAVQGLMLNALIQQLEESSDLDPQIITHLFFQQIRSVTGQDWEAARYAAASSLNTEDSPSLSAAFADLQADTYISHALAEWESIILHGEVTNALELFESIRSLPEMIPCRLSPGRQTRRRKGLPLQPLASTNVIPKIPESSLASFLQLLVRTNNLEGARLLLYDEAFGLRNYVKRNVFQPALLQAAVAIGDKELLSSVVQRLDIGFDALPDDVLYALYDAQVWLGVFKDTRRLLGFMQSQRRLPLKPWLITVTACKYVALASSTEPKATATQRWNLRQLLTEILDGKYLLANDPSQPVDYTERRTLSQLIRILRSAHHSLDLELKHDVFLTSQTNNPIAIPADAFNPLLETIAEVHGTSAAQELFGIWCQPVQPTAAPQTHEGVPTVLAPFEDEKVVTPTLETVQIVLRVPLEDLRDWSAGGSNRRDPNRRLLKWVQNEAETRDKGRPIEIALPTNAPHREVFEWGAQTLRKMGYDDYAINEVIPGAFPETT